MAMNMPTPNLGEQIGIVKPLVSSDEAVKAFNEYQQLKQKLRGDGDFIQFKDRHGNPKEAPTKQWRSKLSRFFGISCETVSEEMQMLPDGTFVVRVTVKATAPNGLYQFGDGSCWSKTKERYGDDGNLVGDIYHNTRSHAVTRAKNRAVLELVGFGEVSAEEIEQGEAEAQQRAKKAYRNGSKASDMSSPAQQGLIHTKASKKGLNDEELAALIYGKFNIRSTKELTKGQASEFINSLDKTGHEVLKKFAKDMVEAMKAEQVAEEFAADSASEI